MGKKPIKNRHQNIIFLLIVALFLLLAAIITIKPFHRLSIPRLTAHSVVVLNCETESILYDKEGDVPRSPASITKLMTLLLVLDDLAAGKIQWDDTFIVGPQQAFTQGSKYGMQPDDVFSVRQLVAGTAMSSGCDCVACLTLLCAENESDFVFRMNQKAYEMGLKGTNFVNATGIDAAGHYMTARDAARLAQVLIQEHPEVLNFTSVSEMEIEGKTFRNLNRLVEKDSRVLGLKTGTTDFGGFSLVTLAEENGDRNIIVLFDSNNDATRYSETVTILDAIYGEEP